MTWSPASVARSLSPSAMADQLTAGDLDAIAAIVATHHKITTARERLLRLLRTEADARRPTTEDHTITDSEDLP